MIHQPRKIERTQESWYNVLDTALEHASHAWTALEREGTVERIDPNAWPPNVSNEVGSAPYHFASMITYIIEVFNSISDSKHYNVFGRPPATSSLIGRGLAFAGTQLLKLSLRIG